MNYIQELTYNFNSRFEYQRMLDDNMIVLDTDTDELKIIYPDGKVELFVPDVPEMPMFEYRNQIPAYNVDYEIDNGYGWTQADHDTRDYNPY